jgi:hypothetical protein
MKRLRLLWKVSGRYEESVGAIEVISRQESQWFIWKLLVTMQIHWFLCKASGRYKEVTAVVESQR